MESNRSNSNEMMCREFVREYFEDHENEQDHENERTAAAVAPYERERITLGDAARLADVDRWTMRDILREHDVDLRLGFVDEDDAVYEGEAANELEFDVESAGDEASRSQ
ncbi:UPF0175 family protein [Natrinema gelatinilyticum]|uniref:UPF0175 family protein n=1 Tax=Natrinema gelatinilyticum TaxID=2961571 RepID=UPI0020C2596C|nr:UPF0175 family protein [Natrinema gelatinilyticum]